MAIKRINVSDETLNALKSLSDELREHPRSTSALEEAIVRLSKKMTEDEQYLLYTDRTTDKVIEELIRFNIVSSREEFMRNAVENELEKQKTSLLESMEDHKKSLGL